MLAPCKILPPVAFFIFGILLNTGLCCRVLGCTAEYGGLVLGRTETQVLPLRTPHPLRRTDRLLEKGPSTETQVLPLRTPRGSPGSFLGPCRAGKSRAAHQAWPRRREPSPAGSGSPA